MFKKIAFAAMAVATASALAQTTTTTTTTTTQPNGTTTVQQTTTTTPPMPSGDGWWQKYDTYHIASVDVGNIGRYDMERILHHDLRDIKPSDAFVITSFLRSLPGDQEYCLVKALVCNYKAASAVRDEVAMARFGTPDTYAWLAYPPLTWTETPGQNSWTNLTFTDNGTVTTTVTETTTDYDDAVALTDDQYRPMRFLMHHREDRADIDYYRAVEILDAGLDSTERSQIADLFHPTHNDPNSFTNEEALDSCIHLIQSNADMVHELNRYSWYNHFDPGYYTETWRWQD